MSKKDAEKNHEIELDANAFEDSMEDRVWSFWNENKGSIFLLVLASFLLAGGVQGYRYYQELRRESLQESYMLARNSESLLDFAESYSGDALGGVAFLELADDAYAATDYKKALDLYTAAGRGLKKHFLGTRASLGQAVASIHLGKLAEGQRLLEDLFTGNSMEIFKAEAHYHLAVLALESGDKEKALSHIEGIESMDNIAAWAYKAELIKRSI